MGHHTCMATWKVPKDMKQIIFLILAAAIGWLAGRLAEPMSTPSMKLLERTMRQAEDFGDQDRIDRVTKIMWGYLRRSAPHIYEHMLFLVKRGDDVNEL